LTSAKNLGFYGIHHSEILSQLNTHKVYTAEESYDRHEQRMFQEEMQSVLAQLKEAEDELIVHKLEKRLAYLDGRIIYEDSEKVSLEELINSVREEKRRRRSMRNAAAPLNVAPNPFGSRSPYAGATGGGLYGGRRPSNTLSAYAPYKNPMSVF
jgi:hypothetical protein